MIVSLRTQRTKSKDEDPIGDTITLAEAVGNIATQKATALLALGLELVATQPCKR